MYAAMASIPALFGAGRRPAFPPWEYGKAEKMGTIIVFHGHT